MMNPVTKSLFRFLSIGSAFGLVMILGFAPFSPLTKPIAHAIPVEVVSGPGTVPDIISATQNTITAANTTMQSTGTAPKDILTTILIITAKTAIDSLTKSIVNWINSGFEGSPAFVTDLKQNLGNLADAIADDFIRGLDQVVVNNTGISIRAPFQDQIARQLREEFYRTTSSYGFDLRHPYQDCYGSRKVFTLNGFFCESQNPANNPYGRYQIARNELFKQLDAEAQKRLTELGWGKGFLSWRGPCVSKSATSGGTGAAKGPASDVLTSVGPSFANATSPVAGNPGSIPLRDINGKVTGSASITPVSLQQKDTSSGCSIRTPGSIIEDQLANTLGSGVRQLELADNFNEIVSALATQLLNQVLGNAGLSGASQAQSGGGQSFVNSGANSTASISSQLFAKSISDTQAQVVTYRGNWQRLEAEARTASQACSNDAAKAADANSVRDLAASRANEATQALATLASIEADRARVTNSGTATPQAIQAVVSRFNDLMGGLGAVASETSGLTSEMRRLAESCR